MISTFSTWETSSYTSNLSCSTRHLASILLCSPSRSLKPYGPTLSPMSAIFGTGKTPLDLVSTLSLTLSYA